MNANLQQLPLEERIKLVEDLWDSIAEDRKALPVTAEQKAELDRRVKAYYVDRIRGRLAADVLADVRRRLDGRGPRTEMAKSYNPSTVWKPFGTFSMVKIHEGGQLAHLKGQVALDRDGQVVGKGDMRVQLRKTLENIKAVLASIGGEMSDIVSLTQYATDIEQFMAAGDIRREFFSEPYPVTTTVQVVRLYHPDLLIEISAIAEIPRSRFNVPGD
ncbi:MAG: Rid family hydrolase [Steroidobacteraceae bacterium]